MNIVHSSHSRGEAIAQQTFVTDDKQKWLQLEQFPGACLLPLTEPTPEGSIHKLRMEAGTVVPVHAHPCDEYVYVLSGTIQTGQHVCAAGMFWHTPAQVTQGPHQALSDVELLTIRLGAMGQFEQD